MSDLPLAADLQIGFMTGAPNPEAARATAELADDHGYDSLWVGDHVAFAIPILDPLLQLAQLAAFSSRVQLGTSVYLLPLRHPVPTAKQVATLDTLCGGRLIFGVGVGGEFPSEYAACGIPVKQRGARLSEAIPLVRDLVRGHKVTGGGRFYPFPETQLLPASPQPGGPAFWCGGRSAAALDRMGRMADGWVSYVVTPDMYRAGLESIAQAAEAANRTLERFDTGHLLFMRLDDTREEALENATRHLSHRYAMDFRRAADRYSALGRPEDVAERIDAFREAGLRHVILDLVGPMSDRDEQLERFAREVRPLL
jgi:alkanesulfonate monooxygenase SsuD/methylene tetrahydromethanopterin reductase-like flavin-dependent oxidoreductase (luciferase family)